MAAEPGPQARPLGYQDGVRSLSQGGGQDARAEEVPVPITPYDVRNASFRVVLRGYAVAEVDSFLDAVEEELTRLHSSRRPDGEGAAEPGGEGTAAQPHGEDAAAEPDDEGAAPALRVLQLAEETASRTVAEAEREGQRIRGEAESDARRLRADAESAAAALAATARAEADRLVAAAQDEAARLDDELALRRVRESAALERRCEQLRREVEELQALERGHRERVTQLLHEQLRLVELPGPLHAVPPAAS